MEILTLLRLNGKRLAALLIVGAITGAVAAAVVAQRPANFEATTTVFVSQALPGDGTSFDVGPLVSDFQQAVTLPEVRRAVAEKLRLPATEIEVIVNRNGVDGGSVEVTATAPNARDAEAISQTVSTEGMRFLARREVSKAANIEQLRSDEVLAAEKKRSDLLAANNAVDPVVSYQSRLANYLDLVQAINDGRVILTEAQKLQIDAQAAQLRQQLPALEQAAEEFEKVQTELENAEGQREAARLNLTAANEVLAAATTDVAISAGDTLETSNVAAIMQAFAAAVVAVLVVGVAFFALADSSRRRPVRALPGEEGEQVTAPVPARGRTLADTVMPAAYRPSALEAMEAALEAEALTGTESSPARFASASPAATVPVSAHAAESAGSATSGAGSVISSSPAGATARGTSVTASPTTATPAHATSAKATSAKVSPIRESSAASSAATGGSNGSRAGHGSDGEVAVGTTVGAATVTASVSDAAQTAKASSTDNPTDNPTNPTDNPTDSQPEDSPEKAVVEAVVELTEHVVVSDEHDGDKVADPTPVSRDGGTEERKPSVATAERPRRARRPEAQSMFARPAETTTTVATTPEDADSEVAPVNAEARQRRSAANRRRLGN